MGRKIIALDAGHGINTYPPSKGVPSMAEFEFNSAVVRYAIPHFERNGFEVLLTQPLDGNDVPLRTRSNLANSKRADLLLSFHADSNSNKSARGHWAFYWHTSANGKRLANMWSEELTRATGTKHRGNQASKPNHWTNFHMVRETNMPVVLMEHGFMSNAEDLALLKSEYFRKQCAIAACKAVCRYFGQAYKSEPTVEVVETRPKDVAQVGSFKDVSKSHWAYDAIEEAKENGWINGHSDGTFRPNEPVTRAQLAVILSNIKANGGVK